MEVEEVLAGGLAILDDPPDDPCEAILALTFCYYDHSLNDLTREMWRTPMALVIEAPGTPNGRRYSDLDRKLAAQDVRRRSFVSSDAVPSGWTSKPRRVWAVLCNNLNQIFTDFVKDEEMTLEILRGGRRR